MLLSSEVMEILSSKIFLDWRDGSAVNGAYWLPEAPGLAPRAHTRL